MDALLESRRLHQSPDVARDPRASVVEMSGRREQMLRDLEQFLSIGLLGVDCIPWPGLRKPRVQPSES